MTTVTEIDFPTENSYEGAYDDALKCMQGFGSYKYADGSVYYGYFQKGKFHGFGCLRLTQPYNFTIKGYFEDGKLQKIETMSFDDGLHVKVEPKGNGLDFSEWLYCSKEDRRFPAEILNGVRAVGPRAMTTKRNYAREIDAGEYDTEMGIYHEQSGCVTKCKPPFKPWEFVSCLDEVDWIKRNCRRGCKPGEIREPDKDICQETIKSHIENQIQTDLKYGEECTADQKPGYKYFAKLYALEMAEAKQAMERQKACCGEEKVHSKKVDDGSGSLVAEKTESRSSFSINKFKDPELERIVCSQTKDDILSLSMDMSLLNIRNYTQTRLDLSLASQRKQSRFSEYDV